MVLERFSTIALVAFVVVAASGTVSAWLRVGDLGNLSTPYGVLVVVKSVALVALAAFGATQRRWIIGRLRTDGVSRSAQPAKGRRPTRAATLFWGMVVTEFVFMGLASGVAAALSRTPPPVDDATLAAQAAASTSPAVVLTGEPLPAPMTALSWITEWNFDLMWSLGVAFAIFFYVAGVVRLARRGDRWPVHRTVLWIAGMLVFGYATNGAPNVYGEYLFSVHMAGHMLLTMLVPLLLVPAAPITLALRAIRKRDDGSRGGREWILAIVHSRFVAFVGQPVVAAVLFAGSLWAFYYTPLFSWSVTTHWGHIWMVLHFTITGYLFVQALIGVDPTPYRTSYPLRLMLLLGTMAFHAFFGVTLMTGSGLLLANWYGAMGWDTGVSALADQQAGGGIAWGIGELPTLALAILVAINWARDDERESKRRDRAADRDGDLDLTEYNAMLGRLAARDRPTTG